MAEFVSDEGTRRRLPSWMLNVSADDRIGNSNRNNKVQIEGVVASKAKRKPKNAESLQEDEVVDFSKPVKKRKRKFNGKDEDFDTESDLQKKTRNAARKPTIESIEDIELSSVVDDDCTNTVNAFRNRKSKGVRRKARGSTSKENVEIVSGDELTAEDLVRIAKEYVEADMVIEKPESPRVEDELETQFPATASHRTEEERSVTHGSTECVENEQNLFDSSKTGDAAFDMLDLYLGSLLRRKPLVEKRTESVSKDVAFTSDLGRRNSENVREEVTVLESEKKKKKKKKSSLRDKVGLFID